MRMRAAYFSPSSARGPEKSQQEAVVKALSSGLLDDTVP
jgi:hypothetical protein